MKIRYYIRKMIFTVLLCTMFMCGLPGKVHAAAINSNIEEITDLGGGASYIGRPERYYLDMEETGMFDGADEWLNKIANALFEIIKKIGGGTVTIFYHCMNFDIAELFREQINEIQRAMHSGIFQPMFILGFCGTAIILIQKMWRRDMMGAFSQIIKVVCILVVSVLIVRDSATALSMATRITKEVSTQALVGMQGETVNTTSFVAQASGILWCNLVHDPWVFIEFGGEEPGGYEYDILDAPSGSEEREALVEEYDGTAFSMNRAWEKVGFLFLYMFICIIKSGVYIAMALLSLFFQLIAILYVVLAPVILVLSLFPKYEGLIEGWLQKIFESQLSVLIVSFIIGLLIKFDTMLYEVCAVQWGWLVVMAVQSILAIFVIIKRNELLGMLGKLQKSVSPGYAQAMMRRGDNGFQIVNRGVNAMGHNTHNIAKMLYKPQKVSRKETSFENSEDWDADDSQERKKTVERPVMSGHSKRTHHRHDTQSGSGTVEEMQRNDNRPVGNASVEPPEAHTDVPRPRMDGVSNEGKIIEFEAYRQAKEANATLKSQPVSDVDSVQIKPTHGEGQRITVGTEQRKLNTISGGKGQALGEENTQPEETSVERPVMSEPDEKMSEGQDDNNIGTITQEEASELHSASEKTSEERGQLLNHSEQVNGNFSHPETVNSQQGESVGKKIAAEQENNKIKYNSHHPGQKESINYNNAGTDEKSAEIKRPVMSAAPLPDEQGVTEPAAVSGKTFTGGQGVSKEPVVDEEKIKPTLQKASKQEAAKQNKGKKQNAASQKKTKTSTTVQPTQEKSKKTVQRHPRENIATRIKDRNAAKLPIKRPSLKKEGKDAGKN